MKTLWPELIILNAGDNKGCDYALNYLKPISIGDGGYEGVYAKNLLLISAEHEDMVRKVCTDLGLKSYLFIGADRTTALKTSSGKFLRPLKGSFQLLKDSQLNQPFWFSRVGQNIYGVL